MLDSSLMMTLENVCIFQFFSFTFTKPSIKPILSCTTPYFDRTSLFKQCRPIAGSFLVAI